jgi:hypothetical protein
LVQRESHDAPITVPTIPGNYLFKRRSLIPRKICQDKRKKNKKKMEKNDIKISQRHDALSVANSMFQLAGKCAVA